MKGKTILPLFLIGRLAIRMVHGGIVCTFR